MKQWFVRFKESNHPAEQIVVEAGSLERAEEVGRKWCDLRQAERMHSFRFIAAEPFIRADESILGEKKEAGAGPNATSSSGDRAGTVPSQSFGQKIAGVLRQ